LLLLLSFFCWKINQIESSSNHTWHSRKKVVLEEERADETATIDNDNRNTMTRYALPNLDDDDVFFSAGAVTITHIECQCVPSVFLTAWAASVFGSYPKRGFYWGGSHVSQHRVIILTIAKLHNKIAWERDHDVQVMVTAHGLFLDSLLAFLRKSIRISFVSGCSERSHHRVQETALLR